MCPHPIDRDLHGKWRPGRRTTCATCRLEPGRQETFFPDAATRRNSESLNRFRLLLFASVLVPSLQAQIRPVLKAFLDLAFAAAAFGLVERLALHLVRKIILAGEAFFGVVIVGIA